MFKKTVLMQVEIPEGRCITCHFVQVIYEDDGTEVARSKPHTVTFMPDANHDFILSEVNRDIATREGMKWGPIEPQEWDRAIAHCAVEHTTEVKKSYAAFKASVIKVKLIKENPDGTE